MQLIQLFNKSTVGSVLFSAALVLIMVFNCTAVQAQDFVRIKNRWKKDGTTEYCVHIQNQDVDAGKTEPGWWSAQWVLEEVSGTNFYRIKCRWKKDGSNDFYLHNQNGKIEAGPIHPEAWSAMWELEKVDATYFRIKNRWKSDQYLNAEGPALAVGPIQPGWYSAMWELEGFKGSPNSTTKWNNLNANDANQNNTRPSVAKLEFGAIPTSPEATAYVKKITNVNAAAVSSNLNNAPAYFTLDMPPIGQQGNEGSCVAWACGYALKSFEMKKSKGVSYTNPGTNVLNTAAVASPEYLFNRINVDNGNCASGAYLVADWPDRGAFNVLKTEGIVTWQEVPYLDNNGCGSVPNDKETASPNAAENRIINYTRIYDLTTTSLKTLLLDQHPIVFMVYVSDEFMSSGPNFVWRSGEGSSKQAHAMTIIGYDDTKRAYRIQNSWGADWGDKGYAWLDYDFAKTVIREAYVSYAQNLNQFDINSPAYVTVYSEAGYVAWCKLSYTLPGGERKVIEENLSLFFVFKKLIPPGATDITLEVGGYGVLDPLNIKQNWQNSNVQACYKIWGTIFDTQYGVVDCAY